MSGTISQALLQELISLRTILSQKDVACGNVAVVKAFFSNCETAPLIYASSYKLKWKIADEIRNRGIEQVWLVATANDQNPDSGKPAPNFRIYAHQIRAVEGEEAILVHPKYKPTRPERNNDSELLIMNFIHDLSKKIGREVEAVHLLTELPPCESCCKVIDEFLTDHKNAHVFVHHTLDRKRQIDVGKHTARFSLAQIHPSKG